jgi:hypothetical protein
MAGNNGSMRPGGPPGFPGGKRPGLRGLTGRRRLALIGVAGESVGVVAGAAGWKLSGEPAWIVMAVVSFLLAIVMLRHV